MSGVTPEALRAQARICREPPAQPFIADQLDAAADRIEELERSGDALASVKQAATGREIPR